MSASDIMLASSRISSEPGATGSGPSASRRPCRWPRNRAVLYARVMPASARTLRAVWEVVRPITSPMPGLPPHPGHLRDGAGLAGPGRAGHHLGAAGGGQHQVRGGGLVQAQPRSGALG